MMVVFLANPVHGLVHVVAPGPVRGRGGARTRAATAETGRGHVPDPTRRARAAVPAVAAARVLAPGIELLCKLPVFILYRFCKLALKCNCGNMLVGI